MTETVHPYVAGAERLGVDLDELAELDPTFLSLTDKREVLLLIARASSRVRAIEARVTACADDVADAEGFRDPADVRGGFGLAKQRLTQESRVA